MDKEKEILQLQMVLKGEKAFTENLKDTITVLKMQVAALLDLNAEYANKIISPCNRIRKMIFSAFRKVACKIRSL